MLGQTACAMLIVASGLAFSAPAMPASGVVAISWDACDGPVRRSWSGPGPYSIYVSVLGIDEPQKAYDIRVVYGDPSNRVPDAWAFQAGGCQAQLSPTGFVPEYVPPKSVAATCPAFMGTSSPSLQIMDIRTNPPTDFNTMSLVRCVVANSYPHGVASMDANTRYFLASFTFDHAVSVDGEGTAGSTCGGASTPMCFRLDSASYLDMDGIEKPFDRPGTGYQLITFETKSACSTEIPARLTTWGQIKSQYRR